MVPAMTPDPAAKNTDQDKPSFFSKVKGLFSKD
jgi:hypothetical protein